MTGVNRQHGAHFGVTRDQGVGPCAIGVANCVLFFPSLKVLRRQGVVGLDPAFIDNKEIGQILHI